MPSDPCLRWAVAVSGWEPETAEWDVLLGLLENSARNEVRHQGHGALFCVLLPQYQYPPPCCRSPSTSGERTRRGLLWHDSLSGPASIRL